MNFRLSFLAVASVAVTMLGSAVAYAQTLNPVRSGWVASDSDFSALPPNQNYLVGQQPTREFRNYFVFDLTGVNSMITSASLELYNPLAGLDSGNGYAGDATETYELTSTTSTTGALVGMNSGAAALAAFGTLGTGSLFSSITASAADNGSTLVLNFNAAGLAYLNANWGNQVAVGGRISSISGTTNQYLFAFTDPTGTNPLSDTPPVNLVLQRSPGGPALTPEVPAGVQVIPVLLAVGGMALYQRRKKALNN